MVVSQMGLFPGRAGPLKTKPATDRKRRRRPSPSPGALWRVRPPRALLPAGGAASHRLGLVGGAWHARSAHRGRWAARAGDDATRPPVAAAGGAGSVATSCRSASSAATGRRDGWTIYWLAGSYLRKPSKELGGGFSRNKMVSPLWNLAERRKP